MQDTYHVFDEPLSGLGTAEWLAKLRDVTERHGQFTQLGQQHFSAFIPGGTTLLVTFETVQGIRALDEDAQPLGWELSKALKWSHLAIVSHGDTWFREDTVYRYFDALIDEGFFDEFDTVLFYGAGPCGYAACAFSVAAPGATVLAIQPQATLAPEICEWDDRFVEERHRDFTTRFGYAPDMIDAAKQVFVIYDPTVSLDAMHAALFTKPHVTKLPIRHLGATVQTHLMEMQVLFRLMAQAGAGKLTRARFAKLLRARREYPPYLRNLLARVDAAERTDLTIMLCKSVTRRMKAPKFLRRLSELEDAQG